MPFRQSSNKMCDRFLVFLCLVVCVQSQNADLLLTASRDVLKTNDGSYLVLLTDNTVQELNSQINKILGLPDPLMWSPTMIRNLPDSTLVKLALLATVGNFTSSRAASWEQPCKVVLNADTGLLEVSDLRNKTYDLLRIIVLILCLVHLKAILDKYGGEN